MSSADVITTQGEFWEQGPARKGAIAAGNPDAVAAGVEVLEEGGNAFDAAVATAFAMGVVEPLDSGLGAGGFATLHHGESGETWCLDFMGAAPMTASYSLYQVDAPDTGYRIQVRDGANEHGHRAIAVPGTVAGLAALSERFGNLPFGQCLSPAVRLAEEGFAMAAKPVVRLNRTLDVVERFDSARHLFLGPDASVPEIRDRRSNPEYGATLRLLAAQGPSAFYEGEIGARIVADMEEHGGFLDAADLANYRALWRAPAQGRFAGRRIFSMAPPSSGYLVIRGLDALARATSGSRDRQRVEAMLGMFRERAAGLGDPAFSEQSRRLLRAATESNETTSLSVMDGRGNAVSITSSLNNHSGVVIPGTGMLMNNQMLLFEPWSGGPNAVAGGKRPASSMMPTVVLDEHGPELALGASGSARIPTALMQVVDQVLYQGASLPAAITAPRLHAEGRRLMADAELEELTRELAEDFELTPVLMAGRDSAMGSVQAVRRAGPLMEAVGDPRAGASGRVI